jgi:aquaglyceroporin related protein
LLIVHRGVYREAIYYTDPKLTPDVTGLAFYDIPPTYVATSTVFFNSFLSSALYVCIAFALGDDSNTPPGAGKYILAGSNLLFSQIKQV